VGGSQGGREGWRLEGKVGVPVNDRMKQTREFGGIFFLLRICMKTFWYTLVVNSCNCISFKMFVCITPPDCCQSRLLCLFTGVCVCVCVCGCGCVCVCTYICMYVICVYISIYPYEHIHIFRYP